MVGISVQAQPVLTIEAAMQEGLKNNFAVQMALNEQQIAQNNNSYGNAGALPQLLLNTGGSRASNNSKQEFSNPSQPPVNRNGVITSNVNASIALSWTVFGGFKMYATKARLEELQAVGELSMKLKLENLLAKIITAYYNIVSQKQQIKALTEAMQVSEERVKIASKKLNIGAGSKVELLQAKVDLNAERSALMKQWTLLTTAKQAMNELLNRNIAETFEVSDSITVNYYPKFEELKASAFNQNYSLLTAQRAINVAKYSVREAQSQRLPSITLVPFYGFSKTENQTGIILLNQNIGLNLGFTASWNLFNGFTLNAQIKNARLAAINANLQYQAAHLQVETAISSAYRTFQDNLQILQLEEENAQLAKENRDIALERFKLGNSSALELKEAQRSCEEAITRLVNARYAAKLSEVDLIKLNGELVK